MIKLSFFTVILFFCLIKTNTVSAQLTGFSCLTPAEKAEFDETFIIKDLISATVPECVFENPVNKVYLALSFLKKGAFSPSTKSTDQSYFNVFPEQNSVFEYITERIQTIKIENCNSLTIAYVFTNERFLHEIHICADTITKLAISASSLAATMVHESRHLDPDDKSHVKCTQGSEIGREATCDQSREQKGGYHFGTEYSIKVAKYGKNFHPAIYASLRADAIQKLINRFNKVPQLNHPEYAIVREQNSNNILIIDQNLIFYDPHFKINGQIYDRNLNSALVVNIPNKKELVGFDLYNGTQTNVGTYASQINQMPIKPQQVDLFFSGNKYMSNSAMIDQKKLLYEFKNASGTTLSSGSYDYSAVGEFDQFIQPELCDSDNSSIYLKNKNQEIYKAAYDIQNKIYLSKVENCKTDILAIAKMKSQTISLKNDLVLIKSNGAESALSIAPFNSKYNFLSQSFNVYDFFIMNRSLK